MSVYRRFTKEFLDELREAFLIPLTNEEIEFLISVSIRRFNAKN